MQILIKCQCGNEMELDLNDVNSYFPSKEDSFSVDAEIEKECENEDNIESLDDVECECKRIEIRCRECNQFRWFNL